MRSSVIMLRTALCEAPEVVEEAGQLLGTITSGAGVVGTTRAATRPAESDRLHLQKRFE